MSSETPKPTSESAKTDPPVASQEENGKQLGKGQAGSDEHPSADVPGHASRSIAAKDSTFQGLGGSQKWGTRGPSVRNESSAPDTSHPVTPIPALGTVSSPSKLPALDATARKGSHYGRSFTSQYREFELHVTPSNMNHQAYIERQGYYGPFTPNRKTIMAEDLDGRVPLEGLIDCQVGKAEVPLRIRIKWTEKGTLVPFSLKALYEEKHGRENTT